MAYNYFQQLCKHSVNLFLSEWNLIFNSYVYN